MDRIARYAASVNLDEADPRNKPILDSLGRFYKSNPKARKIGNYILDKEAAEVH